METPELLIELEITRELIEESRNRLARVYLDTLCIVSDALAARLASRLKRTGLRVVPSEPAFHDTPHLHN
jgi:hypothetical protein